MSNNQTQRGRFNGRGRGNDRGGGFQGQRDSGRFNNRYHNSQNRSSVPPRDDEDDFMFEIHPNRIDTVKFINAQRKLCDYVATRYADVSKLFSYGIETTYEYPETPDFQDDPGKLKAHIWREQVKLIEKRREDYKFNKKLVYGVLWKHCSLPLQNSIRGTEGFSATVRDEDVVSLWAEEKRLSTVGVMLNADPEKLQRDADFRFTKVHQLSYESVSMFYDRYLQECNAWFEAGNTFVESEIVMEGGEYEEIDELNPRVIAIRVMILLKKEKKKVMNF